MHRWQCVLIVLRLLFGLTFFAMSAAAGVAFFLVKSELQELVTVVAAIGTFLGGCIFITQALDERIWAPLWTPASNESTDDWDDATDPPDPKENTDGHETKTRVSKGRGD